MKALARRSLFAATLLSFVLALLSPAETPAATPPPPAAGEDAGTPPAAAPAPDDQDDPKVKDDPQVKAGKYQKGRATISTNSNPACPVGASASATAPGCTHAACTNAKNAARLKLHNRYPACGAYIRSTAPCQNGPGCR